MYQIKGEYYYNDYTREFFSATYHSLESIFEHLKQVSNNFCSGYHNRKNYSFPKRCKDESDYDWCRRIDVHHYYKKPYDCMWIYYIEEIGNGIVYSDGHYTNGQRYCTPKVEEWLKECDKKANEGFVFAK